MTDSNGQRLQRFGLRFLRSADATNQIKRPELPGLVRHELRHTCGPLAIAAGANILAVQRLLGHDTASMTLDVYGHLFSDDLVDVAKATRHGG